MSLSVDENVEVPKGQQHIQVFITCRNRARTTKAFLDRTKASVEETGAKMMLSAVDDGSLDDTFAVLSAFCSEDDSVVRGRGDLFWAGGMREALKHASGKAEFVLLANDDVEPSADYVARLMESLSTGADIAVGQTVDRSGKRTYGGLRRGPWLKRLNFRPASDRRCDTMNFNLIMMRREVLEAVGGLSRIYRHSLADYDFGLRAVKKGFQIWETKGSGVCEHNDVTGSWHDPTAPRMRRFKDAFSPKGVPFPGWWYFCLRHGGVSGPIYVLFPYLRILLGRRA